ncbi:MAG: hypothetical protein WCJ66_00145 [Verrucomicrobiota bacterium]
MRRLSPSSHAPRYKGGIRHYHNPKARRSSWDQWIDGGVENTGPSWKWWKILGVVIGFVALGWLVTKFLFSLGYG